MREPLYHIGQDVAIHVDLPEGSVSIPVAKVASLFLQQAGEEFVNPFGGQRGRTEDSWAYYVVGIDNCFFNERYLRPLNPDTECLVEVNKVTAKS